MSHLKLVSNGPGRATLCVPQIRRAWEPHPDNYPDNNTLMTFEDVNGLMWDNNRDGGICRNFGYTPDLMASFVEQGYWRGLRV